MRIIDAYYVACDSGKHSIVFYKRLAILLFFLVGAHFVEARDWTVYLYIEAPGRYQEARETVQLIENSLRDDYEGRIAVSVDIDAGDWGERFFIEKGKSRQEPRSVTGNYLACLKEGITRAFGSVTEGKAIVILSGHGTGILAPCYDHTLQKWLYEPDESVSLAPCKQYCSARYEQFCKQVQHIMEGKSILSAQGGCSFLSTQELKELMEHTHSLLGKKLDILGFDACYMAMLEIGYEVKDSVRYLVASQDCEEKEGWNYTKLATALKASSAAEVGRHLVYSYERTQVRRGLDRFSLSVHDLAYSHQLAQAVDAVVHKLLGNPKILEALCRSRTRLHPVTGMPFYVDLKEFLEILYAELLDSQITPEIEGIFDDLLYAREVLNLMVRVSVAGPSCTYLKGCSIYFPYAHKDSSYQGSFVQEHLWGSFLRYFTTGRS